MAEPAEENETERARKPNGVEIWNAAVLFITMVAVIVYAGLTHCLLRTSQGQLRQIKRQFEAEQRPWIGAPQISVSSDTKGSVSFTLVFKNVGRSPTKGLWIDAKLIAGAAWESDVDCMCSHGKEIVESDTKSFQHWTSVPGSDFVVNEPPSDEFTTVKLERVKSLTNPHIGGCILYGSHFDERVHQTKFVAPLKVTNDTVSVRYVYARDPD